MSGTAARKSVIFLLPDLESGGAERIVTIVANHLPREKFLPAVMLLRKTGPYLKLLKDDVEIIDLKTDRIRNSLFPVFKVLRQRKPDILFCGFGEVNAYLSLFIRFFPATKFIARETNVVSKHVMRPEIKFFYRFYNSYHRIICQSDDMFQDLHGNFGILKSKLVKINNPVDFQAIDFQLQNQERPAEYEDNVKNVLAIGNLSARKGFDNLLKVYNFLKDEKVHLYILGDGRDKEALHQLKADLNLTKVHFLGQKKNPYPYIKFADLFILSSRYEGFPNVLLEAGACGTYALANDCPGGIREIVHPKINGEISDIENHEAFARKILNLLAQPHDSKTITQSIKSRFDKEIILKEYEEVLENL